MITDTIGNFLTVIRNGTMVGKSSVVAPYSKICHAIVDILKKEGFIRDFSLDGLGVEKRIKIFLKYVNGESVIHELHRVSTPGKRMYAQARNVSPVIGGLGVSIVTTSQGVLTDKEVRNRHVGGEILCTVW